MRKMISLTTFFLITAAFAHATMSTPVDQHAQNYQIVVNNRILAKVQGQNISVIDVMKKMDVYLNQNYPEVAQNTVARFQFYSSQWKQSLAQMIDNELIIADAEAKQVKVSDGDLRETIQERFGPNIMSTLDKLGITYEEARKMILAEMIVQRMTWIKINSKAIQSVNPKDIKLAYQNFCIENPPIEEWDYQVVAIRSENASIGEKIAEKVQELLATQKIGLDNLSVDLASHIELDPTTSIQVSNEMHASSKEISENHKEVLFSLPTHTFSLPILQKSRASQTTVHRIFYLKDHKKIEQPRFEKMATQLENHLIHEAINKESAAYIKKIRQYFGYDEKSMEESIPSNFQPFSIK